MARPGRAPLLFNLNDRIRATFHRDLFCRIAVHSCYAVPAVMDTGHRPDESTTLEPSNTVKIIGYLRLSTDKQDEQSQREQLDRWAASNSRTIDTVIVDRVSGGVPWQERQLAGILATLAPGDMIVVSEVSRIARSTAGVLTFVQAALSAQVAVVAVAQRMAFDASLNSHITLTVLGLCAEIERSLLRDRTRAALAARRAAGQKLGRPVGSRSASKLDARGDEIRRLVKAGVAIRAIARLLPCSPTTLYRWLGES